VWNYANEASAKAARPFAWPPKWLSAYDLDKLTAGATSYFERIGSDTIHRINAEFATRRKQFKKVRLRWRVSRGAKRSLGWIPFKAVQLKRHGKSLRFSGKSIRVYERHLLEDKVWKSGCFAQDSVGDWWLCLPVTYKVRVSAAPQVDVGIDLGLKDIAATSDGENSRPVTSIGVSSNGSHKPSAGVTNGRPSACTDGRRDDARMPCINSQGK
jgi:putative transposase